MWPDRLWNHPYVSRSTTGTMASPRPTKPLPWRPIPSRRVVVMAMGAMDPTAATVVSRATVRICLATRTRTIPPVALRGPTRSPSHPVWPPRPSPFRITSRRTPWPSSATPRAIRPTPASRRVSRCCRRSTRDEDATLAPQLRPRARRAVRIPPLPPMGPMHQRRRYPPPPLPPRPRSRGGGICSPDPPIPIAWAATKMATSSTHCPGCRLGCLVQAVPFAASDESRTISLWCVTIVSSTVRHRRRRGATCQMPSHASSERLSRVVHQGGMGCESMSKYLPVTL